MNWGSVAIDPVRQLLVVNTSHVGFLIFVIPALGGMVIGLFGSFAVPFAFEGNTQWVEIYTFLILIGVLIFRPTGILGEKLGRTA